MPITENDPAALLIRWLGATNRTLELAKRDLELVHRQASELRPTFGPAADGEPDAMGDLVEALALFAQTAATAVEATRTIIGKQIAAFSGTASAVGEVH